MLSDPMTKTPAVPQQLKVPQRLKVPQQLKVPPPVASVPQSVQNVVVASLSSNWVLYEVSGQELQLQRLLRQQSLFPRPPSTSTTELTDSCHFTSATSSLSAPCSAETGPHVQRDTGCQVCAAIAVDCPPPQRCRRSAPSYTNYKD